MGMARPPLPHHVQGTLQIPGRKRGIQHAASDRVLIDLHLLFGKENQDYRLMKD